MNPEIYLSVATSRRPTRHLTRNPLQRDPIQEPHRHREPRQKAETSGHRPQRTLAPLRQHIHPRRLSRILRRQIRRLRENRAPAREPEAPQGIGGDPDREQNLNDQLKTALQTTNRSSRPTPISQNHRQPNRRAGQNDINSSNAGEVFNFAIVKLQ